MLFCAHSCDNVCLCRILAMLLLSQEAHDVRRGGRPHVHFHGRAGAGGDLVGYRQWKRANGFFDVERYTRSSAASLTVDLDGQPADPEWPAVDVIVGNPPFLGESKRDEWLSPSVRRLRLAAGSERRRDGGAAAGAQPGLGLIRRRSSGWNTNGVVISLRPSRRRPA